MDSPLTKFPASIFLLFSLFLMKTIESFSPSRIANEMQTALLSIPTEEVRSMVMHILHSHGVQGSDQERLQCILQSMINETKFEDARKKHAAVMAICSI